MKTFGHQIYAAVRSGKLTEPFTPDMVRRACPGQADHTYGVFLPKQRIGDPGGNTELFVRLSPGSYRLKN
jgi:hypothetical protein